MVFFISICIGVLLAYKMQLRTGDLLLSVFAVIAALLVPYLMSTSPALAWEIAFWLMVNLLVAMIVSGIVFVLFPEPEEDNQESQSSGSNAASYDVNRRLFRLAVIAIPLVIAAFVLDVITPFVLIFVAIQSTQIVADSSSRGGLNGHKKNPVTINCNGVSGLRSRKS